MRKFISILLSCVFIASSLSGCWDAKEIDDWTYAYTIGVDKGVENLLRFTFQVASLKKASGRGGGGSSGSGEESQSGGQKNFETISIDAPTFFTGVNMVEASVSRTLSYMHTKYLIISEELAREGVAGLINGMIRSRQIRRTLYIIIVKGKASEFVENFDPRLTEAISKAQEGFMTTIAKDTGFIMNTSYHEFVKDLKTTYRMPAAPIAAINDFSKYRESGGTPPEEFVAGGRYTAGELPRKGGNKFDFFGTALFDGDKMVGELNGIQTRLMLMVRGEFAMAAMSMADPLDERSRISIDTKEQKKPDIKVEFRDGKPIIHVKLYLEGDLQNVQSPTEYESIKLNSVLENKFKADVKGYLDETIKQCQSLNVDVFGFGEKAVTHFLTIQEWEEYNWLSHFKEAEITTEVDFVIRRTGTLLKTNPTRNSQGEIK